MRQIELQLVSFLILETSGAPANTHHILSGDNAGKDQGENAGELHGCGGELSWLTGRVLRRLLLAVDSAGCCEEMFRKGAFPNLYILVSFLPNYCPARSNNNWRFQDVWPIALYKDHPQLRIYGLHKDNGMLTRADTYSTYDEIQSQGQTSQNTTTTLLFHLDLEQIHFECTSGYQTGRLKNKPKRGITR